MMAAVDATASRHPARDLEDPFSGHQSAIKEMVQEGHTNDEIVAALAQQGLITSPYGQQPILHPPKKQVHGAPMK